MEPEDRNNSTRLEKMLAEYHVAQSVGHHTDTIIHEVTAIVWGADTLLLGFILEAGSQSRRKWLIIGSAAVGILMTVYVPIVLHLTKISQRIAYRTCRQIEKALHLPHRLNTKIDKKYPKWRPGTVMVWLLTIVFLGLWAYVIINAWQMPLFQEIND